MILRFKEFFEAISGTEIIGSMGPNYGQEDNSPMGGTSMVNIIYSRILGKLISYDDYLTMYGEYLKRGGSPLHGFNRENLEKVSLSISES
jgi:hypothetical protein